MYLRTLQFSPGCCTLGADGWKWTVLIKDLLFTVSYGIKIQYINKTKWCVKRPRSWINAFLIRPARFLWRCRLLVSCYKLQPTYWGVSKHPSTWKQWHCLGTKSKSETSVLLSETAPSRVKKKKKSEQGSLSNYAICNLVSGIIVAMINRLTGCQESH